jgi:hypothetical protein
MIYSKENLIQYCVDNSVILDKEYDKVNRETRIEGKCINECNNHFNKTYRMILKKGPLCKTCSVKNGIKKANELFIKKYNGHPLKNKEVREKCKRNNMAKYGSENTFQVEKFKEKGKQTCLEKYGVLYATQNKEILEKMKQTNIERYGSENTFQVEEFKEKSKETCILKFGVPYPLQNSEIMSKNTASQFKKKTYILPSKKEISIQGYEHFALDELLKTYNEDDIISGNENVPDLWYENNDKIHRHYVDIFIPNENLCIEVKSTWTLECNKDNVFIKQAAAKDLGYNYEIWVYDNKGNKINTFK